MHTELSPGDIISPSGSLLSDGQVTLQPGLQSFSMAIFVRATKKRVKLRLPWILVIIAFVILCIGVMQALNSQRINHQVAAAAQKAIALANEGKPSPAPATIKPTSAAVSNYSVAPDMPKYLLIPKLNVDARIYSVGLTGSGAIGTPDNVYDTDWYNGSSLPGQPGAMLIDGHVSSWTTPGVFYDIKSLVAGDEIKVERGDGTMFSYKVVSTQTYPSNNVDMAAALTPITPSKPGLNLITCTGTVIAGTNEFNERVVVFAEET